MLAGGGIAAASGIVGDGVCSDASYIFLCVVGCCPGVDVDMIIKYFYGVGVVLVLVWWWIPSTRAANSCSNYRTIIIFYV